MKADHKNCLGSKIILKTLVVLFHEVCS